MLCCALLVHAAIAIGAAADAFPAAVVLHQVQVLGCQVRLHCKAVGVMLRLQPTVCAVCASLAASGQVSWASGQASCASRQVSRASGQVS